MRVLVITVGIAATAVAAWYYFSPANTDKKQEVSDAPETVQVERATIDQKLSTTGRIVANREVEIKSKASGQITQLPYDVSDVVTSGDLVAELDPIDELRNVANREALLAAATARASQARRQLEISLIDMVSETSTALAEYDNAKVRYTEAKARMTRNEELFERKMVSKETLDASRSEASNTERALRLAEVQVANIQRLPKNVEVRRQDVSVQEAEVRRAQSDLDAARQRLTECRIFAPVTGVVTSRPVQTGQIIASGISNVGGGTAILSLADVSKIFANASVDEADIGKVKLGQRAIITTDAFPGRRFIGKVTRIASKGTNTQNVVTFEVKIEVESKSKSELRPEMTSTIEIAAEKRVDALSLPNEAIQFDKQGYFVEVPNDKGTTGTTRKPIEIGISDGLRTEITSGALEGMLVAKPSSSSSKFARGAAGSQGGAGRGMQRAAFSMRPPSGGGRR